MTKTPAAEWRENGEPDPHASRYTCEREDLTLGRYSDDSLANGAFMNYDQKLDIARAMAQDPTYHSPIAWMTAVKDRIRWLSRREVLLRKYMRHVMQGEGSTLLHRTSDVVFTPDEQEMLAKLAKEVGDQ